MAKTESAVLIEFYFDNQNIVHFRTLQNDHSTGSFVIPAGNNWDYPKYYIGGIQYTGPEDPEHPEDVDWFMVDDSIDSVTIVNDTGTAHFTKISTPVSANLGKWTSNIVQEITAATTLRVISPTAGQTVICNVKATSNANEYAAFSTTVQAVTVITQATDLPPMNISGSYNLTLSRTGGTTGIWDISGGPSWLTISNTGVLTASASSARTFPSDVPDGIYNITVTYTDSTPYLSSTTVTKEFVFRVFDIVTQVSGGNSLPNGQIGQLYNGTILVLGDLDFAEAADYYNVNKPANFNGGTTSPAIGKFKSEAFYDSLKSWIEVESLTPSDVPAGTGTINTNVPIVVTKYKNGTSIGSPVTVSRVISLTVDTQSKAFSITPTSVTTKASAAIDVKAVATLGTWTDSTYTVTCPTGFTINGGQSSTINNDTLETITIGAVAPATYNILFERDGIVKTLPIIITSSGLSIGEIVIGPDNNILVNSGQNPPSPYKTANIAIQGYQFLGGPVGYYKLDAFSNENLINHIQLANGSGVPVAPGGLVEGTNARIILSSNIPSNLDNASVNILFYLNSDTSILPKTATIIVKSQLDTLTISPSTLPQATVGVAYSQALTASGGTGPYTWSFTETPSPSLNMVINASTGVISGTPATASATGNPFLIKVKVIDSLGATKSTIYSLIVVPAGVGGISITEINPSSFAQTGSSRTCTITGTGFNTDPTKNLVSIWQSGMSFPNYWTVTASSTTSLTVAVPDNIYRTGTFDLEVFNTDGTDYATGNISVTSSQGQNPYLRTVTPSSIPANSVGKIRLTGDAMGNGTVGWIKWKGVEYEAAISYGAAETISEVPFGEVGTYPVSYRVGSVPASNVINIIVGTAQLDQIKLNGSTSVTIQRDVPYNGTLSCSGGTAPYTFSISSSTPLPTGLVRSGNAITGTPTGNSTTIKVSVVDSSSPVKTRVDDSIILNIEGGVLSTPQTQNFTTRVGSSQTFVLVSSGGSGTKTWTSASGILPPGLTLNTNGTITGTCTGVVGQSYSKSVTVTDITGTASGTVVFNVLPALSSPNIISLTPDTGAKTGGTEVTLNVTGVLSNYTVKFGTVPASRTGVDNLINGAGTIKVIAPVKPLTVGIDGIIEVTLTNTDGAVSSPKTYVYVDVAIPIFTSLSAQDGPFAGGRSITVTGQNFTSSLIVALGDIICQSTFLSSTQATFITPAIPSEETAVLVSLRLTNEAGSAIVSDAYTYRPPPIITAVVPNTGPSQGGTIVYITGKNFFERNGVKPRVFIGDVEIDPSSVMLVNS